mgnify:CR=1 FL=1
MKKKKNRAYYYRGSCIKINKSYSEPWWVAKNGKELDVRGFGPTLLSAKTLQELKSIIDKILEPPNSIKFIKSLSKNNSAGK